MEETATEIRHEGRTAPCIGKKSNRILKIKRSEERRVGKEC
jgi:hypothetical protein